MRNETVNPFTITKAVDFSDQQINDYWVDIAESGGFAKIAKPLSQMPMLILGGKGSGKTHLMRYLSYSLQKIRHNGSVSECLLNDKYLGIYMRCGGLNSGRFQNKGRSNEAWGSLFSYYMDLWLAQITLGVLMDALGKNTELIDTESAICDEILNLFHTPPDSRPQTIQELLNLFGALQKQLDYEVNNCAITGDLRVEVRSTRGVLVFGIPKILASKIPSLKGCLFVFLVDELENLSEEQQKYINTLVREKELPCSFKLGARLYGVKTFRTYSAEEENKEGSEFETVRLDQLLRGNSKGYETFARRLIVRRLCEHGYLSDSQTAQDAVVESIDDWFENDVVSKNAQAETSFVLERYQGRERPYFDALGKKLRTAFDASHAPGIHSLHDITEIIDLLRCEEYPVLEKVNILLFYRDWSRKRDLLASAATIKDECKQHLGEPSKSSRYYHAYSHFRVDLIAQLRRECGLPLDYCGLDTFITMSMGIPRNLLILLKYVISWAMFNGERPFKDRRKPITRQSQTAGVLESAEWFFGDARMIGIEGREALDSIGRLGTLFRAIRFADKPVVCSCTSFTCDIPSLTERARSVLDTAYKWSLLIEVDERQDKNLDRLNNHFQINLMLSPKWDLATYRRDALNLQSSEADAILDSSLAEANETFLTSRLESMTAPFSRPSRKASNHPTLWPEDND